MDKNYPESLAFVFRQEGGYTNHPSDPGGATRYGITIADARKYWKANASASDVKSMPQSVAKDIYRSKYWLKMSCDNIAGGLDLCVFDSGVNSGVGRADKWLAKAIAVTPRPYPALAALTHTTDLPKAVKAYCDIRLSFLHGLRTWGVFGKGWGRRVSELRATALRLALQASGKTTGEVKTELGREVAATKNKQATALPNAFVGTSASSGGTWAWWEWDILHVGIAVAAATLIAFLWWKVTHNIHDVNALEAEIKALEAPDGPNPVP